MQVIEVTAAAPVTLLASGTNRWVHIYVERAPVRIKYALNTPDFPLSGTVGALINPDEEKSAVVKLSGFEANGAISAIALQGTANVTVLTGALT